MPEIKAVYYLPDALCVNAQTTTDNVVVRQYRSQKKTVNNRIVLNKHMINLIIQGQKTVVYPGAITTVHAGELLVMGKGNMLTSEVLSEQQEFRSLLFYFSDKTLQDFLYRHKPDNAPVNHPNPLVTWQVFKQDTFLQDFIKTVCDLLDKPQTFTARFKHLKLEELLLYLCMMQPGTVALLESICTRQPEINFTQVIESNIASAVTIDELAFLCNMSRSTFKRKFETVYGMAPGKWLVQQKMQLAATLLKRSGARPSEVYLEVGYDNHSGFSEAFRKHYGVTPSEFRQQA